MEGRQTPQDTTVDLYNKRFLYEKGMYVQRRLR
jgi:hypothetical protein